MRDVSPDTEIYLHIGKASTASGKSEKKVLAVCDIRINMKINVYRTFVIMAVLYSAETRITQKRHIKLLECFHQKCLRYVLNIKWETHTADTTVLEKAECLNIEFTMLGWSSCLHGRH